MQKRSLVRLMFVLGLALGAAQSSAVADESPFSCDLALLPREQVVKIVNMLVESLAEARIGHDLKAQTAVIAASNLPESLKHGLGRFMTELSRTAVDQKTEPSLFRPNMMMVAKDLLDYRFSHYPALHSVRFSRSLYLLKGAGMVAAPLIGAYLLKDVEYDWYMNAFALWTYAVVFDQLEQQRKDLDQSIPEIENLEFLFRVFIQFLSPIEVGMLQTYLESPDTKRRYPDQSFIEELQNELRKRLELLDQEPFAAGL